MDIDCFQERVTDSVSLIVSIASKKHDLSRKSINTPMYDKFPPKKQHGHDVQKEKIANKQNTSSVPINGELINSFTEI